MALLAALHSRARTRSTCPTSARQGVQVVSAWHTAAAYALTGARMGVRWPQLSCVCVCLCLCVCVTIQSQYVHRQSVQGRPSYLRLERAQRTTLSWYVQHTYTHVHRHAQSYAIFGWNVLNEPRCPGMCDTGAHTHTHTHTHTYTHRGNVSSGALRLCVTLARKRSCDPIPHREATRQCSLYVWHMPLCTSSCPVVCVSSPVCMCMCVCTHRV